MFVEGKVQGKARPRFSRGRAYTPKTTVEYEKKIASAYTGEKHEGGLRVEIQAFFKVPKSYTKKRREAIRNGEPPTKKPDIDNIGKVVLDALNGIAYEDDAQVIELAITKEYSEEREGLDIKIEKVRR